MIFCVFHSFSCWENAFSNKYFVANISKMRSKNSLSAVFFFVYIWIFQRFLLMFGWIFSLLSYVEKEYEQYYNDYNNLLRLFLRLSNSVLSVAEHTVVGIKFFFCFSWVVFLVLSSHFLIAWRWAVALFCYLLFGWRSS